MADLFTWQGQLGAQGSADFRVLEAKFGDGYAQVVDDGLNTEVQNWPLSFSGKEAYVQPILAFLRSHKGGKSFRWTPPLGTEGLYRCKGYGLVPLGKGLYTLTATFQQYFAP